MDRERCMARADFSRGGLNSISRGGPRAWVTAITTAGRAAGRRRERVGPPGGGATADGLPGLRADGLPVSLSRPPLLSSSHLLGRVLGRAFFLPSSPGMVSGLFPSLSSLPLWSPSLLPLRAWESRPAEGRAAGRIRAGFIRRPGDRTERRGRPRRTG